MFATEQIEDIVKRDYRTADVFNTWGINYCCGNKLNLEEVCENQHLDINEVLSDLDRATHTISISNSVQFSDWPLEFMVDYIHNIHHAYLKQSIPHLKATLHSLTETHKKKYPYLKQVELCFNQLADELIDHTSNEEEVIFPYIKQINSIHKRNESYGKLFVRTMGKPLNKVVDSEHKKISLLLYKLRAETNNYFIEPDACTSHQVIYHKLKEFDKDLVQHKHLENTILFPAAMKIESDLLSQ